MNAAAYTFLGHDTTFGACDCCGRDNLKKTVKLMGPNGVVRYGVGCAAKALGLKSTEVTARATAAQRVADAAAAKAKDEADRAERVRWFAFIAGHYAAVFGGPAPRNYKGDLEVIASVKALGGFATVTAAYRAA
jgi:hypothetical protein